MYILESLLALANDPQVDRFVTPPDDCMGDQMKESCYPLVTYNAHRVPGRHSSVTYDDCTAIDEIATRA